MNRRLSACGVIVAIVTATSILCLCAAGDDKPGTGKSTAVLKPNIAAPQAVPALRQRLDLQGSRASQVHMRLAEPVDYELAPGQTLKDHLEYLRTRHDLKVLVDPEAFLQAPDRFESLEANQVNMPKLPGVSLRTALRTLLAQVQCDYYVRDGMVVVTPRTYVLAGSFLNHPVETIIDKKPLAEALHELVDLSGATVVLDARLADVAQAPLSATLNGVTVETAVRLLADMAGLTAIKVGNALYVTSAQNANAFLEQEREVQKMREAK